MFFNGNGKKEELWLPGNSNLKDYSDANRTITNSGTTLGTGLNGESNLSIYFNGSNQLSFGDLDLDSDFTICFWMNLHADRNNNLTILFTKRQNSDWTTPYQINIDDRDSNGSVFKVRFGLGGGGTTAFSADKQNALSDFGEWYHITARVVGTKMDLFVDGLTMATQTFSSGSRQTNNIVTRIGSYASGGSDFLFKGNMCDIRAYSTGLENSAIYQIFLERNRKRKVGILAQSPKLFYSVRRLYPDYSGPCFKIRRSSDDATEDIYFLSNGNVNIESIKDFVGSGDGFVEIWYDQSGNGIHAIQETSGNQPRIASSGDVHLDGGKPAVYFAGSKWLSINPIVYDKQYVYANIVANPDNTTNQGYVWGHYDTNSQRSWVISFENTSKIVVVCSSNGASGIGSSKQFNSIDSYTATRQLVEFQFRPTLIDVWKNGSTATGTFNPNTAVSALYNSTSKIEIGRTATADLSFQGYVQEFSMYDENMIDYRAAVATSINNYFEIY